MIARIWRGATRREDRTAVKGFAGDDAERAVFYPEDDRYLIERDLTVRHYDVAAQPLP